MRVLMTADAVGGVWTFALDLGAWLVRRNVEVVLATMGPAPRAEQRQAAADAGLTLEESTLRLEWMDEPWADVDRAGVWLCELERRYRPDLVHVNGFAHAALPFSAPALVTAHSSVTTWWHAVYGEAPPPRYDEYRARVAQGLAAASRIVAPTRAMLDALFTQDAPVASAFKLERLSAVVPNGSSAPRSLPTVEKEPFVFSAGRLWDSAKNIVTLAAAAERIDWPVYVAGDSMLDALQAPAFGALHKLGALAPERVVEWMARATIYAAPALYEPFGLAVLEAAFAGCALVLGDIPSLRESWDGAALFVEPRDPAALANAIESLRDDPRVTQELGRAARVRAASFSVERMGKGYLGLYRELAGARVTSTQARLYS